MVTRSIAIALNGNNDWVTVLSALSDLAMKFGPFFFSVLFLTYITWWAQKRYSDLVSLKNPPATKGDRALHGAVFIGSFMAGLCLVFFSTIWWVHYNPQTYIFQGVFRNLHKYEEIDSDSNIFFHTDTRTPLAGELDLLHNVRFAVIQSAPFQKGQLFSIDFSKGQGERESLQFEYAGGEITPIYLIEFDPQSKRNSIKHVPSTSTHAGLMPPFTVSADLLNDTQAAKQEVYRDPFSQATVTVTDITSSLIESLQNPRSDVGTKIQAIRVLNKKEPTERNALLSTTTPMEPMLVTMLDLTRHSDRELAYRTIETLQKFDSDRFVTEWLHSGDAARQKAAQLSFFHMERDQAERVLGILTSMPSQVPSSLITTLRAGEGSLLLRPTGSSQGDRYYVRATWDPADEHEVPCLTQLFNDELASTRSVKAEAAKMKGRAERLIYWYSKDWAISISKKISDCGGKAQYVTPGMTN